jgi:hypothetical protein
MGPASAISQHGFADRWRAVIPEDIAAQAIIAATQRSGALTGPRVRLRLLNVLLWYGRTIRVDAWRTAARAGSW